MLLVILKAKKFLELLGKRIAKKKFRVEKVINKENDKLYVKWKVYDHSLNSWIDKKDII